MSDAVSEYWEHRYRMGQGSGRGSRGRNANRKAAHINRIITKHHVRRVVDWGCGDGRVASRIVVPSYLGLDVSEAAVGLARKAGGNRKGWTWRTFDPASGPDPAAAGFDLALSLDVIFHLTSDVLYGRHMELLFASAPLVCISASNRSEFGHHHVRHREFVRDLPDGWEILERPLPEAEADIGLWLLRRKAA